MARPREEPPSAEGAPNESGTGDAGRMPAQGGVPSADGGDTGDQSGDLTTSEIVAQGMTLDIPWETPGPQALQYGGTEKPTPPGPDGAPTPEEPYDFTDALAWANHFNFGTKEPEPKEEGDGTGQVPAVSQGAAPQSGSASVQGGGAGVQGGRGGPGQRPEQPPVRRRPDDTG